jgi:hypothetical protein
MQLKILQVVLLFAPQVVAETAKVCLLMPLDRANYRMRTVASLVAARHINERDFRFVTLPNGESLDEVIPSDFKVEVILKDLGGMPTEAFDRAAECIDAGADWINVPYSSRSAVIAPYLARVRGVPIISGSATGPALSAYPSFFRTVPPDDAIGFSVVDFALGAGWRKLGFLYSDEPYGQGLYEAAKAARDAKATDLEWIQAPFALDLDQTSVYAAFNTIVNADVRIIAFAGPVTSSVLDLAFAFSKEVLVPAGKAPLIGPGSIYVWVSFDSWTASGPSAVHEGFTYEEFMAGSIRLTASGCVGGTSESKLVTEGLAKVDVVDLVKDYTGPLDNLAGYIESSSFYDISNLDSWVGFYYDLVWLGALASIGLPPKVVDQCGVSDKSRAAVFHANILKTEFTGPSGLVRLLENGDRDPSAISVAVDNFDAHGKPRQVGDMVSGKAFSIDLSTLEWSDGTNKLPGDGQCDVGFAGTLCQCNAKNGRSSGQGKCICNSKRWAGDDCGTEVATNLNLIPRSMITLSMLMFSINILASASGGLWVWFHSQEPRVMAAQPFFLYLLTIGCVISSSTIIPMVSNFRCENAGLKPDRLNPTSF